MRHDEKSVGVSGCVVWCSRRAGGVVEAVVVDSVVVDVDMRDAEELRCA